MHNAYCAKQDPDPLCGTKKGTCINGGTLSGNINTNNNIHTWICKKGTQSQSCGCEVLVEGNSRCPNNYELQSDGRCKYMPKYCALKKKEQGGYTRWIHANSYCFGENNPDLGIEEHAWYSIENAIIDDFGLWIRNESYKAQRFNSGKPDEGCISPNELYFNSDRYKNRSCVFKKYDITTSSSRDNGFYLDCDGNYLFADPCPGAKTSDWPTCGLIVDDRPDPVSEPKCGDSKNSCSSGNFKSNSNRSTSTSYSWTCTNGQDEVSCKIGIQCSQETSGDEDAGYCTGDGGRVYLGTSTCTFDYCKKMCEKTLAGFKECPDCCLENRQWRVCNDTSKLSCIKEGLCSWISTSSASISLPKFEYCYKEETGSSRQTTTNSGHSRCGGLSCGTATPFP